MIGSFSNTSQTLISMYLPTGDSVCRDHFEGPDCQDRIDKLQDSVSEARGLLSKVYESAFNANPLAEFEKKDLQASQTFAAPLSILHETPAPRTALDLVQEKYANLHVSSRLGTSHS